MLIETLARRLHLLPNGELLADRRREAERMRARAQAERRARIAKAEDLARRVRRGDESAPLDIEAFMAAAGFGRRAEGDSKRREVERDDREY